MPSSDRFDIRPNQVPGEKPWLLRRTLPGGDTLTWHMNDTTIALLHETLTGHLASRPGVRPEQTRRCESYARKGTGTGTCDRPLDRHGYCDWAGDHIEAP